MIKAPVKVEHVNPFIRSTLETFAKMVGLEAKPGKPRLKKDSNLSYDITGVIGLAGDAKGMVCLSFPKETALKILNKFMEASYTEINDEAASGIGELANIVAGYAKKDLQGLNVSLSLPSVIQGNNHRITDDTTAMAFVIPFETEFGRFDLMVSLKSGE